ncbi:MAG: choice-of-anchor Q domain-containing protein [Parcubacteria group bacterium]|jgi:hypothetical protein
MQNYKLKFKIIFLAILFCGVFGMAGESFAADVYFASSAAGSENGTDCANAYDLGDSYYGINNASNWIAGNTLHICGTITEPYNTNAITSAGDGSFGAPITVKFETDAVLTSPAWPNATGAIYISHNYVNVDGGTNGKIVATLDGTIGQACPGGTCAYQSEGTGINVAGSHCSVTKMDIENLQIHIANTDDGDFYTATGIVTTGDNNTIYSNTIKNAECAVYISGSGTEVKNNYSQYINRHIKIGASSNSSIHDNEMSDCYNWDEPSNFYHHNGIHAFCSGTSSNVKIYDNYFDGYYSKYPSVDSHTTSFGIFLNPDGGEGCIMDGYKIFNNLFISSYDPINYPANGRIVTGAWNHDLLTNLLVVNNTIIDNGVGGIGISLTDPDGTTIVKNNLIRNDAGTFISLYGSEIPWPDLSAIDYNFYCGDADNWSNQTGAIYSFSNWNTVGVYPAGECGFDQHGSQPTVSALNLQANGTLGVGSAAISAGFNLTALCSETPEICFDKNGVARPSSGLWDIGAYEYVSGESDTTPPTVPSGLAVE